MNVYELFKAELDAITIMADMPAAAVVGECLRAVRRAQMVHDGVLRPVAERQEPPSHGPQGATDAGSANRPACG